MPVWAKLRGWARRGRRRSRRRGSSADSRYRSPQEIALQNAADSLGVTLGEYYLDDADLPENLQDWSEERPDADRLDASREEMLTYIEGLRAKRKRLRRTQRVRIGLLGAAGALVAVVGVIALVDSRSSPEGRNPDGPKVVRDQWREVKRPADVGIGVPSERLSGASTELADGHGKVVATAYIDQIGGICSKIAHLVDGVTKTYSAGGCLSGSEIARELARTAAFLGGFEVGQRHAFLMGFAREDVRRVVVTRPAGHGEVSISGSWTASSRRVDDAVPIKVILAKMPFDWRGDRMSLIRAIMQQQLFEFAAELDDGRLLRVSRMRGTVEPNDRSRLVDPIESLPPPETMTGTAAALRVEDSR